MPDRLLLPPGVRVTPVSQMPAGDLELSDGRRLLYQGAQRQSLTRGGYTTTLDLSWWQSRDGLRVLGSVDETPHGNLLHFSVSRPERDPDWAEIKAVREAVFPKDIDVMMVLPREEDYVNLHGHCFHLWQTPTTWGIQ